jgi:RNA polymerase sigma factor (sigma-70 family)
MAEESAVPLPTGTSLRLIPRSDSRLVRLAAAGDERAFAAIYERYHQELYQFCRAILGESHEAQDALQSTMASALRALPGEERRIELRPWLYRVARNECVSHLRRRPHVEEEIASFLPPAPAVDVTYESRERLRLLVADLAALPERGRSALVMRELSGLSYEQIGAALGSSGAAARQTVYEARVALQELEEGRAMECDRVRHAISERDGRVMRGRKLRAHLRGCERCSDFQAAIDTRSADLKLLAPPLTAVAASGMLGSILGGGSATGGALVSGGLGGGAIAAKTLGVIAASAVIGAGAVGGVDLPTLGSGSEDRREAVQPLDPVSVPAGGDDARSDRADRAAPPPGGGGASSDHGRDGRSHAQSGPQAGKEAPSQAAVGSAAGGASETAPAGTGQPETPPGSDLASERSSGHSVAPTTGPPEGAVPEPLEHANPAATAGRANSEK